MNLVSILIPVYNREKYIQQTVQSALSQTYKNIEVIVVDNNSSDNTWAILNNLILKDNRLKIFKNNTNIGPILNWKRCIDQANGKFGKILWSDDLISNNFIEKTITYLDDNSIAFVHTGIDISENPNNFHNVKRNKQVRVYESSEYIEGVLLGGNYPLSPGCALFRMDDLKKGLLIQIPNKINADFKMLAIGNDLLIFLLTAINYNKIAFIEDKLSFFRVHDESITISSDNSKIALHYDIAKAFFVENYYNNINIIKKLNVILYKHLKRYNISKYNIKDITSFYSVNTCFKQDYFYILVRAVKRITKKLGK